MKIIKAESRSSVPGRTDWFTGNVWLNEVSVPTEAASRLHAYLVTFASGARTAWHTHPVGQVLYVVSGIGRVQTEGMAPQTVRPGDTIVFAAGEKHWHGAAADHVFVHLAMQEASADGITTTWLEPVTTDEYGADESSFKR